MMSRFYSLSFNTACVAMMWSIFDQKCGKAANAKNLENAIFVGNVEDLYN